MLDILFVLLVFGILIFIIFILVSFFSKLIVNLLDHLFPELFHMSDIVIKASGVGEKTKFIIDIQDKGYEYYKNIIENWLEYNHFSKFNEEIQGRYLKYYNYLCRFKFGFHYYREGNTIVIEAWIVTSLGSNPLTKKTYPDIMDIDGEETEVDIVILPTQKSEYIYFLDSLLNMPEKINDTNYVSLKDKIDYSKIKNQKKEKKFLFKFCVGAIFIPLFLVCFYNFMIYSLQPKPSNQDRAIALNLIQKNHPSFHLEKSTTEVNKYNDDYVISYLFFGTMDTPNSKNEKVIISMSNSKKNNYFCIDEACTWGANIHEDKKNGQQWNFYLK